MNKQEKRLVLKTILVSIAINLILPFAAKPLATEEQIKPPNGADRLSFLDQIMHMFVHHAQVPITSSLIVAIIVGLSLTLSLKIN
tara:strand:+ start:999 stop:1253 length:255 start_codon:yes stop_codon:yes gene_type:complete